MTSAHDTQIDDGSGDARFVRNAWYVAAWSRELTAGPLGRTLLGQYVALFRDERGTARAVSAVCPHRGSDLAAGRVVDGSLQCPLHGWRFAGDGRCVRIPSQSPGAPIPAGARLGSFPVVEQQGILWIWMGDRPPVPRHPPRFDFWIPGPDRRRLMDRPRLWPASFVHVVEQTIDDSHLAFVHAGAVPEKTRPLVPEERVTIDADGAGFRWEDDERSPWQRQQSALSLPRRLLRRWLQGMVEPRRRYARCERPGLIHLHVLNGDGRWDVIVVAITPCDAHHTWTFGESIRTRAPHAIGQLQQRRHLRMLLDEDHGVASTLLYRDWRGFSTRISVRADHSSLTFRKLYAQWLEEERRGGKGRGAHGAPGALAEG